MEVELFTGKTVPDTLVNISMEGSMESAPLFISPRSVTTENGQEESKTVKESSSMQAVK
jgi:hypothetical protein